MKHLVQGRILALALAMLCVLPLLSACRSEKAAHTHQYGEWESLIVANCSSGGASVRRCACGMVEVQSFSATGKHVYENYTCTICGHSQYDENEHDHIYGNWQSVMPENCGQRGVRVRYCFCGQADHEIVESTGAHQYNDARICTVCGAGEPHTHIYGVWSTLVEPTCGKIGIKWQQCACGHTVQAVLPITGEHVFDAWGRCTVCDTGHTHIYGNWMVASEATCSTSGLQIRVCTCGESQEQEILATGLHSYENRFCINCGQCMIAGGKLNDKGKLVVTDINGTDRLYDDLPESLDYDEEIIQVLYWADVEKAEFEMAWDSDDLRYHGIYQRNLNIEERLNVRLRFKSCVGNSGYAKKFVEIVENDVEADLHSYDIVSAYSRTTGLLLTMGLLADLTCAETSYLDFDKPWWPESVIADLSVGDSVYLLTGDMAPTMLDEMHCVYFNTMMADQVLAEEAAAEGVRSGSAYLFELAQSGRWTLDRMLTIASGCHVDTDRGGRADAYDIYGLCSINYCATSLYGSLGLRMLENSAEGWQVSADITSTTAKELGTKLRSFFASEDYWDGRYGGSYVYSFTLGNALFCLQYYELAENALVSNFDYGVLPCPKLQDGKLSNYRTVVGNACSIYGVSVGYNPRDNAAASLSMLTAVLECWGSEGYRNTTPAVLKHNLYYAYSQYKAELLSMYELIRGGVVFDPGRIAAMGLETYVDSALISTAVDGGEWSECCEQYAEDLRAALDGLRGDLPDAGADNIDAG